MMEISTKDNSQPIFESIFGKTWDTLPSVMHMHYSNRPYSHDTVVMHGKMDISISKLVKVLRPILNIIGALVPYASENIPTQVIFRSDPINNHLHIDRKFNFNITKSFHSTIIPYKDNEVIEMMRFGIGWHCSYSYDSNKITLNHIGYIFNACGIKLPLPISWIFGKIYAEERVISQDTFYMQMTVLHRLWGEVYKYQGTFTIEENE